LISSATASTLAKQPKPLSIQEMLRIQNKALVTEVFCHKRIAVELHISVYALITVISN
jgi:hypothetical protein